MYATAQEMRGEGIEPGAASDIRVETAIRNASALIDKFTRQWFEPRRKLLTLDGRGVATLFLRIPIIGVERVSADGRELAASEYVAYSSEWDRKNPRIVRRSGVFPKGRANVEALGTFGFVDTSFGADDKPIYSTPEPIRWACRRLVVLDLLSPAAPRYDEEATDAKTRLRLAAENTDGHSYSLVKETRPAPFTGDADIDAILLAFATPLSVGGA